LAKPLLSWEDRLVAALEAGDSDCAFGGGEGGVANTPAGGAKKPEKEEDVRSYHLRRKRAADRHAEEQVELYPLGHKLR
jgi:hypothetical protein